MPSGKQNQVTILGIDPGLADTGYGLISASGNQLTCLGYGSIKTASTDSLSERLWRLEQELEKIIKKNKPEVLAIEQLFFCKNAKTALVVGQARGVVLLVARKNNLKFREFTPLQVKQGITGYGQAEKKQIQQMVKSILGLKSLPQPDDAADALAIAICAASQQRFLSVLGA